MATLAGFSGDIAVGHKVGLRWFHLALESHGSISIASSIEGSVVFNCGCGDATTVWDKDSDQVQAWLNIHQPREITPVLKGACRPWRPGENTATCIMFEGSRLARTFHTEHTVPHEGCHCGFWNYWHLGEIYTASPSVVGLVKGYGNVIEGERGFRCSLARILGVWIPYSVTPEAANEVEAAYQVPVFKTFGGMLELCKDQIPPGQPELKDAFHGQGSKVAANTSNSTAWVGSNSSFATFTATGGNITTFGGGGGGGSFHGDNGVAGVTQAMGSFVIPMKQVARAFQHLKDTYFHTDTGSSRKW